MQKQLFRTYFSLKRCLLFLAFFPVMTYAADNTCDDLRDSYNHIVRQNGVASRAFDRVVELQERTSRIVDTLPSSINSAVDRQRTRDISLRIKNANKDMQRQLAVVDREWQYNKDLANQNISNFSVSDYRTCDVSEYRPRVLRQIRLISGLHEQSRQLAKQSATLDRQARRNINDRQRITAYATRTLPATREEGQGTPACGNPSATTTADMMVDGLGYAIDSALGNYWDIPIAEYVFENSQARSWVKGRLGWNNGVSACANLCVAYDGRRIRTRVVGKDRITEESVTSRGYMNSLGWAQVDNITHARTNKGNVTCANVRHWRHDRERTFELLVEYEY